MADARQEMSSQLGDEWDLAKNSLKFDNRYFNSEIRNFLDTVFNEVEKCLEHDMDSIITEIDQDSPDYQVFRARCFDSKEDSKTAIENDELGPPPAQMSAAGRLNVAGIPVFYGATNSQLALAETRPSVGCYVVVAQFEVIEPIRLLDIERLGSISEEIVNATESSDELMYLADFLHEFCKEITKTVSPKEKSLEYIATQAISEYLSIIGSIDVHGLLYDSSQAIKRHEYDKNIMLFNKYSDINKTSDGLLRLSKEPPVIHTIKGISFSTNECTRYDTMIES